MSTLVYPPTLMGLLSPGGAAPTGGGLLDGSESDGTNVFNQSLSAGNGTTISAAQTQNADVAPDGTTSATFVREDGGSSRHILYFDGQAATANKLRTFSVYAKANGRRYLQLAAEANAIFDLQTGAVTDVDSGTGGTQSSVSASCQAAVNGYYKCTLQYYDTAAGSGYYNHCLSNRSGLAGANVFGNVSYTGDNTSGIYLWRSKLTQV